MSDAAGDAARPSLVAALADYDGTHVRTLEAIRDARTPDPADLAVLVDLAAHDDAKLAAGATWLLRAWVEGAGSDRPAVALPPDLVHRLAGRLDDVTDPWARLHLCQTVRSLSIPGADAGAFAAFLEACRTSPRPFLRAWSADGLHHLARQHPSWSSHAARALEDALGDPAASVRARARRIVREG